MQLVSAVVVALAAWACAPAVVAETFLVGPGGVPASLRDALKSALLEDPLHGALYLAAQGDGNPFGSLFAIYLVIEDPRHGIFIKLPGKVAKRLKLPRLIGTRTVVLKKATTAKLRVKLTKKAAKKLTQATKAVRIAVKGKLTDAAGITGKATAGGKYKN